MGLNIAERGDLYLWSVDRTRGVAVWKRRLASGNKQRRKQNMSSPSPVTDGRNVWVMTGTGILKAFDFDGNEIWTRDIPKDYGRFGMQYEYGASPLLYEDSLYVAVLHGWRTSDPSYVLRISKANGRTIWRVERPTQARSESLDAYTTPALLRYGTSTEIVVTGADVVTGHDPDTGKELWRANGLNPSNDRNNRIVASPVVFGEMIYAPSLERPMLALKAGGRGDVTRSHVLWSFNNGPDVPTPVTDGTYVYVVNDRGIMWCLDAKTGREVYGRKRLRSAGQPPPVRHEHPGGSERKTAAVRLRPRRHHPPDPGGHTDRIGRSTVPDASAFGPHHGLSGFDPHSLGHGPHGTGCLRAGWSRGNDQTRT